LSDLKEMTPEEIQEFNISDFYSSRNKRAFTIHISPSRWLGMVLMEGENKIRLYNKELKKDVWKNTFKAINVTPELVGKIAEATRQLLGTDEKF